MLLMALPGFEPLGSAAGPEKERNAPSLLAQAVGRPAVDQCPEAPPGRDAPPEAPASCDDRLVFGRRVLAVQLTEDRTPTTQSVEIPVITRVNRLMYNR